MKFTVYWTPAKLAELYEQHKAGASPEELAVIHRNVTPRTIVETLRRYRQSLGIPTHQQQIEARWIGVDERLAEAWNDPNVSMTDLENELGFARRTLQNRARKLGLGNKVFNHPDTTVIPRPSRPSGKGAPYAGRRYEDDPRDPKPVCHVRLQPPVLFTMGGVAA